MLLAAVLTACSGGETAQTDTAAPAAATPPAPAALTAADVAGTWNGESMAEGSDSVVSRWTVTRVSDTESKFVYQGSTDSVSFTTTFDADSMMATSQPFTDPETKARVMFRSVGRLSGGTLSGTSAVMLADKPDSVVERGRWRATRAP
jgi:hypothetical protein